MNFFPNGVLSENPKTRNLFYRTPFTRKKYNNIINAVALSLNILKSTNYNAYKNKIYLKKTKKYNNIINAVIVKNKITKQYYVRLPSEIVTAGMY